MVVGATGLFGGLLVRRLLEDQCFTIIGTGRTLTTLDAFTEETGAESIAVDRNDTAKVKEILTRYKPFAVVDCAGPFQYYGSKPYQFAEMVIEAGSHYIDIADASDFVAGITRLNRQATRQSVAVISGASSTPAISAAAADHLVQGLSRTVAIETAIVPGNRTRRTLSVMRAIIGQVGQSFEATIDGKRQSVVGWSSTRCINLSIPSANPVKHRLASLVNTPDVALFPGRYQAQTVTLRAGLELRLFHRSLQLLGWLVRLRLLRSLVKITAVARCIASYFENIGSDAGGMQVVVTGRKHNGEWCRRYWELAADDGRGPEIPTLPVSVLLDQLANGLVTPGARAAPGEVTLDQLAPRFNAIAAQTAIYEKPLLPVFQSVLGDDFYTLPAAVQELHSHVGAVNYRGYATSAGPTGLTGRLAAWCVGFPGVASSVPVTVALNAAPGQEQWQRTFAGSSFKSILSCDKDGFMQERFGPITMRLGLHVHEGQLHYPVHSARLFGLIPLPEWTLPGSVAHETVDEQGRFVFDVALYTPFGARIAHYRGWLVNADSLDGS